MIEVPEEMEKQMRKDVREGGRDWSKMVVVLVFEWLVLEWEKQRMESKQEKKMKMKMELFGNQTSLSITTPITNSMISD